MMLNLESFYACNPSFTLCLQRESQYYVDLGLARGEDVTKRLRRAIALSSNKPTAQFLTGHIGSGKTTELLRLKFELEQQGFVVIYGAIDHYAPIHTLGLIELWLMIFCLILQKLEQQSDSVSLSYLPSAIAELEKSLRLSAESYSYIVRLQRILQALQGQGKQYQQLEPRLKNSLVMAGEELTVIEVERLKQSGKKGLVLLIDNLDRLSSEQVKIIFGEGSKYLHQFQCHMIYTLPMMAIARDEQGHLGASSHTLDQLPNLGNSLVVLPNLMLRDRQGHSRQDHSDPQINHQCLDLLRQVVLTRISAPLNVEKRLANNGSNSSKNNNYSLEYLPHSFDQLETLDQLCLASHGNLPYLISLLYGCLQQQNPPIQQKTLQQILQMDREMRLSTISQSDRQALQKYVMEVQDTDVLNPEVINLCRRLLLFINHDSQGYWYSSPYV